MPQEVGFLVNDFLVEHFPNIVDSDFTAEMEEDLDRIAEGEKKWNAVISEFYKPFAQQLSEKEATVEKKDLAQQTDQECDKCGGPMVIRMGRFGKFLACSNFPKCKNTKSLEPAGESGKPKMKCPKCADGHVVTRRTKRGKIFYGCSNYPKCDFASWDEPVPEKVSDLWRIDGKKAKDEITDLYPDAGLRISRLRSRMGIDPRCRILRSGSGRKNKRLINMSI